MSRENIQSAATTLRRVDPEANMARFYRLVLCPDLWGCVALVREWGRIGQPGRVRVETHPDTNAAAAARDRLVASKTRKGYVATDGQARTS